VPARWKVLSGVGRSCLRLFEWLEHNKSIFNYQIGVPLLVFASSATYIAAHPPAFQSLSLLSAGTALALVSSGAVLVAGIYRNRRTIFYPSSLPDPSNLTPKKEALRAIPIMSEPIWRDVQVSVVRGLFPTHTADDDFVFQVFKKNPKRSLAIYSDDEPGYVGIGAIWPLYDTAGNDLLAGRRDETELTLDDLVKPEENKDCKFCLISVVGVLDAETKRGKLRAVKLMREFGRFIRKEFVKEGANKTFIAIAEHDGVKWCDFLGMECRSIVNSYGGRRPLYVRDFTSAELEALIERLSG
jgi:hypothetical protein